MISVICPVYNEELYIYKLLEFFTSALPQEKELFIVDGNSTDKTKEIVNKYSENHTNIFLLNNERRVVPFALNLAIKKCKGNFIVRLDAHTEYATDYFEQIIKTFNETGADIVGGPMRTIGKTDFQKAVAYATCTKFGVGDSAFHDEMKSGYVDSVYLGAWRKEIFDDVGYFDEALKRNQDDDFHYRAKAKGKKIYLNPQIKSFYYPRNNAKKLLLQYFQYGFYKPTVLKKTMAEIKMRHLIPSTFLLYLIFLPVLLFFNSLFCIPGVLYLLLCCRYALASQGGLNQKLNTLIVYPLLHISYGSGFLAGLLRV